MCGRVIALAIIILFPATTLAQANYPTVTFGGRLQLDYTFFNNDKFQFENGGEMRRGRLFAKGKLYKDWEYKVEYDFSPGDPELKDGYLRYGGFDNTRIWVGNFKQPSSLEQLTSSNFMTFLERAVALGVTEGRRMGVAYQRWGNKFTWMSSAYGDEANGLVEGNGVAGRFVYIPQSDSDILLHLGASVSWNKDADDTIRLRVRPVSHQDKQRILDTGNIEDVDDFIRIGLETAYVHKRFSAQAELTRLNIKRRGAEDLSFTGYYAFMSFFITDDRRAYNGKDGIFDRVIPTSDKGALEIALRFGNLDLTDEAIMGGAGDFITLGLNYYVTSHLRLTANYIFVNTDEVAGDDDPSALQLRIQFDF